MTTVDMKCPHQSEYSQVVFLKAHLKMVKVGMKPRPPMTVRRLMEKAKALTGASFSARDYDGAIKALEARRDALLTYMEHDAGSTP